MRQAVLFQTADALCLTGLTRHQLREWTGRGRRQLVYPDIAAGGPGRHALFAWQTLLTLRLLSELHSRFKVELSAWKEAAQMLRKHLEGASFPILWGRVVLFQNPCMVHILRASELLSCEALTYGGLILPLEDHLRILSEKLAEPAPEQLSLLQPMVVSR